MLDIYIVNVCCHYIGICWETSSAQSPVLRHTFVLYRQDVAVLSVSVPTFYDALMYVLCYSGLNQWKESDCGLPK